MSEFDNKYKRLNNAQREAVDKVEGPVIVIAGPGTGKTELLSMRVANILRKTDALAQNILCLSFTDSAAAEMRQRLIKLMGKEAYHVAVHTFHSFGSETINKNGEYFYKHASFKPADELAIHGILNDIFTKLKHDNPLASKMNGEFTQLKRIQNTISDFKRSGLSVDEIQTIIKHNQAFIDFAEPLLSEFFDRKINKNMIDELSGLYQSIQEYLDTELNIPAVETLSNTFLHQMMATVEMVGVIQKTTPITKWRDVWLEKDQSNKFIFKDRKRYKSLMAATIVYLEYLNLMEKSELYDYDDMILNVVHAIEVNDDLRYNLQEQYQYILVDEFQDTNGAQLRIVLNLIDNEINNGQPNILIVGDDDQAIYSFQGAEFSNILNVQKKLSKPTIVNLRENYRSAPVILDQARNVITQGVDRLENVLENIDKTPIPNRTNENSTFRLIEAENFENELQIITGEIKDKIASGQTPGSIALLARNHKDIRSILPYLSNADLPIQYEHKENVLEFEPIRALILIARVVCSIEKGNLREANGLLPELLAQSFWGIPKHKIWDLSIGAYNNKRTWLEEMLESNNESKQIANFLIKTAFTSQSQPLEQSLDSLIGNNAMNDEESEFVSPLKQYYFNSEVLETSPNHFLSYLSALRHIRNLLREHRPGQQLYLCDFVDYIDLTLDAKIKINLTSQQNIEPEKSVHIMTAHKAKGLEFETVYIINACDNVWGSKSRGMSNRLSYPANMSIGPVGESSDERLRLFFVAMTRAKRNLIVSYASEDSKGKQTLLSDFLNNESINPEQLTTAKNQNIEPIPENLAWESRINVPDNSLENTLAPILESYLLSVTHLNSFIDITRDGPRNFLIHNILHFPQAIHPAAALGSAVHSTLKHVQEHVSATSELRPVEDSLYDFEIQLKSQRLGDQDFEHQLQKGSDALQSFLNHQQDLFSPSGIAERNLRSQGSVIGEAKITGIIDNMVINNVDKTISLIDYKTGPPMLSWKGKTDFDKIKLHKFKQQLMFYKLLIESSRDYRQYTVSSAKLCFVQPDSQGRIHDLTIEFVKEELDEFSQLIEAVWAKIINLEFDDTNQYDKSYKGILSFESDLINNDK